MMVTITYCLAVILFCTAFYFTHILATCNKIISISRTSVTMISDANIDDDTKEKKIQAAAINMLKSSFILLVKLSIILSVTILPLWVADITGLAGFAETSRYSLRIDVLLVTTVVVTFAALIGRRVFGRQ